MNNFSWAAQDSDGSVYLYEMMPRAEHEFLGWRADYGVFARFFEPNEKVFVEDWPERIVDLSVNTWGVGEDGLLTGEARK